MIYIPKEPLIQLPPWSRNPLPSTRGLARRCCVCCPVCIGTPPVEVFVAFTGFVSDACTSCESLNDTFTLPYDRTTFTVINTTCHLFYEDSFVLGDCTFDIVGEMRYRRGPFTPAWALVVTISEASNAVFAFRQVTSAPPALTCNAVDETVPTLVGVYTSCTTSSPTCQFTT